MASRKKRKSAPTTTPQAPKANCNWRTLYEAWIERTGEIIPAQEFYDDSKNALYDGDQTAI